MKYKNLKKKKLFRQRGHYYLNAVRLLLRYCNVYSNKFVGLNAFMSAGAALSLLHHGSRTGAGNMADAQALATARCVLSGKQSNSLHHSYI